MKLGSYAPSEVGFSMEMQRMMKESNSQMEPMIMVQQKLLRYLRAWYICRAVVMANATLNIIAAGREGQYVQLLSGSSRAIILLDIDRTWVLRSAHEGILPSWGFERSRPLLTCWYLKKFENVWLDWNTCLF